MSEVFLTMYEKRIEARRLRSHGSSLPEIVRAIGVAKGTVFGWIRDIALTPDQAKAIHRQSRSTKGSEALKLKYQTIRDQYRRLGAEMAKPPTSLMVAGCMLYWGEGSKTLNQVCFTNTDVHMIELFSNFLRNELGVSNDKLKISVYVHKGYGNKTEQECRNYWANVTKTSKEVTVYNPKDKRSIVRKNKHPYGICVISVYDVKIIQMIYGAIEAIIGKPLPYGR